MFSKFSVRSIILLTLFTLFVGGSVLADDGRINRAPYHFGGDTLFCNQDTGCTLLNKEGHELANWPQSEITAAFAAVADSGKNAQVNGEGQGTYGPTTLWAVSPDATTGNNTLCMIGFDEWGKQNNMCFEVTQDYHFQQAPLPAVGPSTDCIINLAYYGFFSIDGIHYAEGYDIWATQNGNMTTFLYWTASRPDLADCNYFPSIII
jgi:hypothetical protein